MKIETKDSVNHKIKDIRQRVEKDRQDKIQDGKNRGGRAGEKEAADPHEEGAKAGGSRKSVRFWDVPQEFKVDYTSQEDMKDLVAGPNLKWENDAYQPAVQHGGRGGGKRTTRGQEVGSGG